MADCYHNSSMTLIKSMTKSEILFKKTLEVSLFLLLIATPLIHTNLLTEQFEFPKMFLIYFMGSFIIFIYLLGLVWKVFPFKKLPTYVYIFFLTQIISSLFSDFGYTFLWGYYPRLNGGLISSIIYFGILTSVYSTFDYREILRVVFYGLLLSIIPISFIGIFQYIGSLGTSVERVYSTIGQPNWSALHLVWGILIISHRFLKDPKGRVLFLWWLLFGIVFVCLWFTYSLSGFLALFAGVSSLMLLNKSVYFYKRIPILFLIPLIILLFFPGMFFMRVQDGLTDVLKLLSTRLLVYAQSSYQISDPGFVRLGLWEGTLRIAFSSMKNLLFGTGPETFSYIFPKYRTLSLNFSSEWDYILNKPHNYYLELLSQTGVFSLFFHVVILLKAFLRKHPWGSALFAAFSVSNFFGWPIAISTVYFWILFAGVLKYEKKY